MPDAALDELLTISVSRSSGKDGAIVVFIDTADDAGPIRIRLNDEVIHADVDHESAHAERRAIGQELVIRRGNIEYIT